MKKLIMLAVLAAFISGAFVFAQQPPPRSPESEFYYFNFPIEKIYLYRQGYVVLYRNGSNRVVRTHIPNNWFTDIGGTGEVVYIGSGRTWPSMTVFYKNGEFSHVRLTLRRERTHVTWGMVPLAANLDEHFRDIEEVKLDFF